MLADCLGLDTSKYRVSTVSGETRTEVELQPLESQIPDSVRFKEALPLVVRCRACKDVCSFKGIAPPSTSSDDEVRTALVTHAGITCPHEACQKVIPNLSVILQLEAQIRQHLARYYAAWLVCDDSQCGQRTRQMSVYGHRCLGPKGLAHGCTGTMRYEYSEKMAYNQLLYLSTIFDVDRTKDRISTSSTQDAEDKEKIKVLADCNRQRFETAKDAVKGYLDRNGWQWVQMDSLFSFALQALPATS